MSTKKRADPLSAESIANVIKKDNTPSEEGAKRRNANLKPVQKGEVRNPWGVKGKNGKGGYSFKAILEKVLFLAGENGNSDVIAKTVMDALISQAAQGNIKAIEILLDRFDGKVATKVEVSSEDGLACIVLPEKVANVDDETP